MLLLALGVLFMGTYVILKKRRKKGSSLVAKLFNFLKGIGDGMKSVKMMERRAQFIAHTFFIWIMYFLMSFVLFKSMKGVSDISIFDGLWVMVSGGFGMVFPAPGGIGSYQWAVMLGFESLGYDRLIGIAVGNVVWITQTAMLIISGLVGYFVLMFSRIQKSSAK
jgi:hypothetical protein